MEDSQHRFDVFISHSSKDSLTASAMKHALESKGIRCWKAPDNILPGESWPSAITRALSHCRAMVLVWSGNSMTSMEVSKELTLAMQKNLTVLPFRIEKINPVGDWEYHLANTHWMDASEGLAESHFGVLGDRLLRLIPARTEFPESLENRLSLMDLEQLIEQALEDGVLTEQERARLLRDAADLGHNKEEFNSVLDSRLAVRKREMAARVPDVHPPVPLQCDPSASLHPLNAIVYPKDPPLSPHLCWVNLALGGLAQIIYGQGAKGLTILAIQIFSNLVFPIVLFLLIGAVSIYDAYLVGKALKMGKTLTRWQWFPDVFPTVGTSASPTSLKVPVAEPTANSTQRDPVRSSATATPPPAVPSTNPSKGKLILFGSLWSFAFFFGGVILVGIISAFSPELGAISSILILLLPVLAVWMTIKRRLPGTRKT